MSEKVSRTTKGMRDALFDEIDALRNGTGDVQKAQAIAALANNIVKIARAEMEFYKLAKGEGPEDLVERAKVTALPHDKKSR